VYPLIRSYPLLNLLHPNLSILSLLYHLDGGAKASFDMGQDVC
jgi:hypothetical protein